MIDAKTAYQSGADLIIGLYPHGAVVHRIVIRFGNHIEILLRKDCVGVSSWIVLR